MSRSHDPAHLAHVELLTPRPEASLDCFVRVMGLTVSATAGDSAYLRGWDDYRHFPFRTASEEALHRRVRAIEPTGLGLGRDGGDPGRLDHLDLLAPRVAPMRACVAESLGCLLSEQTVFDDGGGRTVVRSEAERRGGQAWGLQTIASLHTHGTPATAPGEGA